MRGGRLNALLQNTNAIIIICTGTTAFPTQAWTKSGEEDVYSLNINTSIAALDEQELNTPNVDTTSSNEFIAHAWDVSCKVAQK